MNMTSNEKQNENRNGPEAAQAEATPVLKDSGNQELEGTPRQSPKSLSTLGWIVRVISWPFLGIGGVGLGATIAPMLRSSPHPSSFLDTMGWTFEEFFLRLAVAGVIFLIGLVLMGVSEKL